MVFEYIGHKKLYVVYILVTTDQLFTIHNKTLSCLERGGGAACGEPSREGIGGGRGQRRKREEAPPSRVRGEGGGRSERKVVSQ